MYVNYPNSVPAMVLAVSSSVETLPRDFRFNGIREMDPAELREQVAYTYKFFKGVYVKGGVELLVHVQPLRHFTKLVDGSYTYTWENTLWYYPYEMVSRTQSAGHHMNLPRPKPLKDEFPVSEQVVCFLKDAYGVTGTVKHYGTDKRSEQGSVAIGSLSYPSIISQEVVHSLSFYEPFLSVRDISKSVQASPRVLSRLLGNFKIKHAGDGKVGMYQLGLDLTNFKEWLHVEGWARWSDRLEQYEFSKEVVTLLQHYKATFSSLWHRLEQLQSARIIKVDILFPDSRDPLPELKRISLYVSGLPTARLPWSPYGSVLAGKVQIRAAAESLKSVQKEIRSETLNVNPALLILSYPQYTKADFYEKIYLDLGEQVVNINDQDLPYVPFGCRGLVVGFYENGFVEVVFDDRNATDLSPSKVVYRGNLINVNRPYFTTLRTIAAAGDKVDTRRSFNSAKPKGPKKNAAAQYLIQPKPQKTTVSDAEKPDQNAKKSAGMVRAEEVKETIESKAISPSFSSPQRLSDLPPPSFSFSIQANEFVPTGGEISSPEGRAFPKPF